MRCWRIDPNHAIQLDAVENPEPGPGEIRVAVKACGINRADLLQIAGHYPAPAGFDSTVPGLEYAGVIDALGAGVRDRTIGERVMGLIPSAAWSESIVVHERTALSIPPGLDFATAAATPEAFLTAYRALFLEAGLKPGQWCLVRPASAAVGLAAVQLAAALGARPIGSSRDPARLATATAMGAVARVSDDAELGAQLRELTAGAGVAVVMDMVGTGWNGLLAGLREEGTLVLVGLLGSRETTLDLGSLLRRRQRIVAMTMRSQPLERRIELARIFADRLAPLFDDGRLRPLPHKSFGFESAPEALADLKAGGFSGKRVLVMAA